MSNKISVTTYISIITLSANEINDSIKRHKVAEWASQVVQ